MGDYLNAAKILIKKNEGYSPTVYLDTNGIPTGGWGHAFLTCPPPVGHRFDEWYLERYFEADFREAERNFYTLGLDFLTDRQKMAILDMLFNLGLTKFKKFKKFIQALRDHNYGLAQSHMLDSKWARQVGGRARANSNRIFNG